MTFDFNNGDNSDMSCSEDSVDGWVKRAVLGAVYVSVSLSGTGCGFLVVS